MALKYDLTNKKIGKLTIIRKCSIEERPSQNHGNYWLCKCDCGNECKVPTSYLTGNGNYTQTSCGCDRKKRAFQATTQINISSDFLDQFSENFEKYLLIHSSLIRTANINVQYYNSNIEEYKKIINYFWSDPQFNAIYNFWEKNKNKNNTFYDWAKPSLDHIIPISRGGKNELSNFQFLTVFENLSKRDMTMEEWNNFKKETCTRSSYYIEEIMKGGSDISENLF